jgi:transcriptional regulator with XRE-family HTH domain
MRAGNAVIGRSVPPVTSSLRLHGRYPSVNDFHPEIRPEDTGARLRAIRELGGLSSRDVARAAGLSSRELAAVERGRRRLSPDEVRALSAALNVRPEVLVADGLGALGREPAEPEFEAGRVDLPTAPAAASPFDLPEPERRRDFNTRKQVEDSWSDVRAGMEGVIRQCMRVSTVGSGDDVFVLLDSLESEIRRLRTDHAFQREVTRHQRTIAAARSRGAAATRESTLDNTRAR